MIKHTCIWLFIESFDMRFVKFPCKFREIYNITIIFEIYLFIYTHILESIITCNVICSSARTVLMDSSDKARA